MRDNTIAFRLFDQSAKYNQLDKFEKIYIYGAGNIGQIFYEYACKKGYKGRVQAYIVSSYNQERYLDGIPVLSYQQLTLQPDSVVVVAASKEFRKEMCENCKKTMADSILEVDEFDNPCEVFRGVDKENYLPELKKWYKSVTGLDLNIIKPESFNEKIQWIKMYESDERKTICSDKYEVRKVVKELAGEEYLIPLYGKWNSFDEIDFSALPASFVMKCNHGSGMNEIIKDKSQLNIIELKKEFDRWMEIDYSLCTLERHYHSIQHKIIAEELIDDPSGELNDYKFWCFDGEIFFVQVDIGRFSNHRRNLYTTDWEFLPYSIGYPNDKNAIIKKPEKYEEMKNVVKSLAKGFNHVRVDLYYSNNKIYFGEMTFTHGSGIEKFSTSEFAKAVGAHFVIPN